MTILITAIHVIVCVFLMLTVLLQAGKGGGMGSTFGGGSSTGSVFGGSGAGNFLRKLTAAAATIFMLTSIALAYLGSHSGSDTLQQYSKQQRDIAKQRQDKKDKALQTTPGAAPAPGAVPAPGTEPVPAPGAGENVAPENDLQPAPSLTTPPAGPSTPAKDVPEDTKPEREDPIPQGTAPAAPVQ